MPTTNTSMLLSEYPTTWTPYSQMARPPQFRPPTTTSLHSLCGVTSSVRSANSAPRLVAAPGADAVCAGTACAGAAESISAANTASADASRTAVRLTCCMGFLSFETVVLLPFSRQSTARHLAGRNGVQQQ